VKLCNERSKYKRDLNDVKSREDIQNRKNSHQEETSALVDMKVFNFVTPWLLFSGVYATGPKEHKPKPKLPRMEHLYTATVYLGTPLPLIPISGGVRGGKATLC
jgi:hypothetical protein